MFNIGFKICKIFDSQEFTGSGEKLLKQDLVVDIGNVGRFKKNNILAAENRTSSIIISLFGEKTRNCDFKIGDSGSIVGSFSQLGNGVYYSLKGVRFENPSYNLCYQQEGMKRLPQDFGKKSFEFVLSELHKIKLAQEKFDLVDFFRDVSSKVETAIQFDETCRLRTVFFFKNLPTMIFASGADLSLFKYLLDNGLDVIILSKLSKKYEDISSSDLVENIAAIEAIHYEFIGLSQLEIERKRIQRKYIFFSSYEMRWFDFEGPICFLDHYFLSSLYEGFIPDSIEMQLINQGLSKELVEQEVPKTISSSIDDDLSSIIENEIASSEMSFEEYMEWCNFQDVLYELDMFEADYIEEQKLKEERDLLEHPPFDEDELDEWNDL